MENKNLWWYKKTYDSLVSTRKIRGLDKTKLDYYTEKHHIVPKCMGGKDEDDNYVLFTAREHIIAHCLLLKIYPDHLGILRSTSAILMKNEFRSLDRISTRTIASLREAYAARKDELAFEQVGKVVSETIRENIKKSAKTRPPMSQETKTKVEEKKWRIRIQDPEGRIFNSMSECASFYKVSYQTIQFRLKNYPDSWKKIYDGPRGFSKSLKVQGPDGTVYNSLRECAKALNRSHKTIKRWIEKYPQLGYKFIN